MTRVYNLRKYRPAPDRLSLYIGRSRRGEAHNPLCNPYSVQSAGGRREAIRRFAEHFSRKIRADTAFRAAVEEARGKDLLCFCSPQECHGDVIQLYFLGELAAVDRVALGERTRTLLQEYEPHNLELF